jgi:hypothetical protein
MFVGNWADGKRDGFGQYKYVQDGTEYQGQWHAGKMHGLGKLLSRDGKVLVEGEWVEGELSINISIDDI